MKKIARMMEKSIGLICMLIILFSAVSVPCGKVKAQENPERVMKVAFPEAEGYTETDKNGNRHGIVVDYLNEIAKYTGWKYDYIDTDGETMITDFLDGKYDLMGGTFYMPQFEEYFAYPDYNCGYSKSVLLAKRDNIEIKAYDWRGMNGKTIGVYENAKENIRRLEIFLQSNDVDCTLKYYTSEQLDNGNLYSYLLSGEVDLLLGNNAEYDDDFRVVAQFDSQPHYIVTTPGNQEVLDGLNMAMAKIIDSNPRFAEDHYEANFSDGGVESIFLNAKELSYIEQKQTVSVAVVKSWHPLFCLEKKDNLHEGIIPDILEKIKEYTGLEFTYVYADTYEEALKLVQQGKADILGAFLGTEEEGRQMDMALTAPMCL